MDVQLVPLYCGVFQAYLVGKLKLVHPREKLSFVLAVRELLLLKDK